MAKNFVAELLWRGMIHDIMPDTEKVLNEKPVSGYIGFDPTSDSLHIGSLVQIMILMHFQRAGHSPIVLIGGATGMIGDPSGKSQERNLLDQETLEKNIKGIERQLSQFLDFKESSPNAAKLVNNYDWMSSFSLIDFIRNIGKYLTVNYMMAKDSVKKRLVSDAKEGMSYTEFSYQLIQGYDFLHLYKHHNCLLQMGGSDQWGNITTGSELVRRKEGGKAYALTCPLITKSDGTKFGKTESGNIWLDKTKTSPYKFYQYWLNTSDEDAARYIKIFTFLDQKTIINLIAQHKEMPHLRQLQRTLANEVTRMVHSEEERLLAVQVSEILFGNATSSSFKEIDEVTFLDVFEGVPQASLPKSRLIEGITAVDLLASSTGFLSSNGEARRALKENSISVNKEKIKESFTAQPTDLICDRYLLLQRGKKNYFLVVFN